jgi:predicted lactoylglutathione lyase
MEQRISLITLGVKDLDRSGGFYERLGWKRSLRAATGVVFFQTGSMAMSLFPREDLAKDARVSSEGSGFAGVTLAVNMRSKQEVDEALQEAARAGGRIVKAAEEAFWGGYSGYFCDLDGHLWEVAWNPRLALAADGSIKLPD